MIQSDMKQGVMGWKKVKHIAPTGWKHDKVPLFWNERKGPDFWRSLIASMDIGAVVHLGAGLALPLACIDRDFVCWLGREQGSEGVLIFLPDRCR